MDVHDEIDFGRLVNLDIEQHERALIAEAMKRCKDNRREASKLLGISRFALARRLDSLGMKPEKPAIAAQAEPVGFDDIDEPANEAATVRLPPKRQRRKRAPAGPVGEAPSEMVFSGLPETPAEAGESAA